jgi:hypothetical protein
MLPATTKSAGGLVGVKIVAPMMNITTIAPSVMARSLLGLTMIQTLQRDVLTVKNIVSQSGQQQDLKGEK